MNLNNKTKNETLLDMQGKNRLLNVVEQQTASVMVRLLESNNKFHKGKCDTLEEKEQDYLTEICVSLDILMEEATYKEIRKRLQKRYNNGMDLATMIIKNGAVMKIAQWQSHQNL